MYFDGHKREDVVTYRQQWVSKMMEYKEFMEGYVADNEEIVKQPVLSEGQNKIVMVTHDVSTFYSNDGKDGLWLKDNENAIRKKNPGGSIMVGEFQCAYKGGNLLS